MLLLWDLIPRLEEHGPEYLSFWKELAASKDAELSAEGRDMLARYEEVLKREPDKFKTAKDNASIHKD